MVISAHGTDSEGVDDRYDDGPAAEDLFKEVCPD